MTTTGTVTAAVGTDRYHPPRNLRHMFRPPRVVTSSMTRFGLAGLGAVLAFGALTLVAVSRVSMSEALNAAEERARLAGYGIVEPALDPAIVDPSPRSAALEIGHGSELAGLGK